MDPLVTTFNAERSSVALGQKLVLFSHLSNPIILPTILGSIKIPKN